MKEVISKYELLNLKEKFKKVFKSKDPFGAKGEIFNDLMTDKLILCPVFGYQLDEKQFDALIKTCKSIGVKKIYFSEVEGYDLLDLNVAELDGKYLNHNYEIDISNQEIKVMYNEYLNMELILENAIYSEDGIFGVLVSHEEHAVVGGTKEFTNMFKSSYPEWVESRKNFEDMWEDYSKKNNVVESWYGNLIKYIYK